MSAYGSDSRRQVDFVAMCMHTRTRPRRRGKTDSVTSLERARLAVGLSQLKLAKLSGLSHSRINRYEAGAYRPSKQTAEILARTMGRDVRDVFPEYDALTDCNWGRWTKLPVSTEGGAS